MKIAIIGTGNVGSALAGSFSRAGHEVTLAARDRGRARAVAEAVGASAAESVAEAASRADVIVLAVPFGAIDDVARSIAPEVAGKVVIDASNPLRQDYSGLATDGAQSAAERLADGLGEARVVKAFNTIFASLQADPTAHAVRLDALYATDDESAADSVAELIGSIGFRPVNAGPLARAREMEAMGWLNISLQLRAGGDWRSSFVLVGAPAAATSTPAGIGAAHA